MVDDSDVSIDSSSCRKGFFLLRACERRNLVSTYPPPSQKIAGKFNEPSGTKEWNAYAAPARLGRGVCKIKRVKFLAWCF